MKCALELTPEELANRRIGAESLAKATEIYNENGCLYLENALDPALVAKLGEEYLATYGQKDEEWLGRHSLKLGDKRYMVQVDVAGAFNNPDVYASGLLYPILQQLLGADMIINSFGSVIALPGSDAMHLHVDHVLLSPDPAVSGALPPYAITVVIPLVDLTEETGTTALMEGSHKVALNDTAWLNANPPALPLPKRGGVYFMDYRLIHMGTWNTSPDPRPIMYVIYSRPWFTDAASYRWLDAVKISPEDYAQVPAKYHQLFVRSRNATTIAVIPTTARVAI